MNVTRKDALISNVGDDEDYPGSFEVILSTPEKDRDGDELAIEDWKTPLPEHITFDTDHGMSVEKTVGSGVPSIEDGKLIVRGTYSTLPRAQEARTLVKERHIRTVSVAFMSEKVAKAGGKTRTVRELLNGAFVAIPSNRGAHVLSAKAGARNSKTDQQNIQAAHDATVAAGADCGPMDDTGAAENSVGGKEVGTYTVKLSLDTSEWDAQLAEVALKTFDIAVKGKYTAEQLRTMLADGEAMKGPDGEPSYPIGDLADLQNAIHAVGRGNAAHNDIRAYVIRRAKALGHPEEIPDNWNPDGSLKAFAAAETKTVDPIDDPAQVAQAVDAALDEGWKLLEGLDQKSLPEPVQQALGCFAAAGVSVDHLLDVMNVANPDEETTPPADAKSVDAEALVEQFRAFQMKALAAAS